MNARAARLALASVLAACAPASPSPPSPDGADLRAPGPGDPPDAAADDGAAAERDLAGANSGAWVDPYAPLPAANRWPAGTSDQVTPSGVPFTVSLPAGDTAGALLVVGGWSVQQLGPGDGAITIAIQGDGTLGPQACPRGGMSGVPHLLDARKLREVLTLAGQALRFDHGRVFVEADGNNAGWGVSAALDAASQPYVTGVYVPWAEYNNAPCRDVATAATAASPRALFISAAACDDTYCPLRSCIDQLRERGYDVTFRDPLTPATCDCRGACPGAIARPHFKGPGPSASIKPWVLATRRSRP